MAWLPNVCAPLWRLCAPNHPASHARAPARAYATTTTQDNKVCDQWDRRGQTRAVQHIPCATRASPGSRIIRQGTPDHLHLALDHDEFEHLSCLHWFLYDSQARRLEVPSPACVNDSSHAAYGDRHPATTTGSRYIDPRGVDVSPLEAFIDLRLKLVSIAPAKPQRRSPQKLWERL
jgi:hypothetical protein